MDVLSSVLQAHQVRGTILSDGRYAHPWGLRMEQPTVAGFHLVLEGTCFLMVAGSPPIQLFQGDVVVIPGGATHVLADHPATPAVDLADRHGHAEPTVMSSSSSSTTHLACGAFHFQRGTPPALLSVLPPVIHLRAPEIAEDDLLRSTLRLLAGELEAVRRSAAGSSVLIDRLTDALFVGVIRRWLAAQPVESAGWLQALRDEGLGRAMAAMYQSPGRDWSVPDLARLAGMSRATFARRFATHVGATPAAFLQRVRLELAGRLLTSTEKSVAEVAAAVGYASEFSFSRAFKKAHGTAPGAWRASEVPGGPSPPPASASAPWSASAG